MAVIIMRVGVTLAGLFVIVCIIFWSEFMVVRLGFFFNFCVCCHSFVSDVNDNFLHTKIEKKIHSLSCTCIDVNVLFMQK